MRIASLLIAASAAEAATLGFSTYREIIAGADNSGAIAYTELDRSNTVFLNIQIVAGQDNAAVVEDFKTLCENYSSHNISLVPRVRYGTADGTMAVEPEDSSQVLADVKTWAGIFKDVASTIEMPVIQAGFLGAWAEWHDGPLCDNNDVKRGVVEGLQASGGKIAVRTPMAHKELFDGDRSVTIHNDCIFDGGPDGYDGGTFPDNDRQTWVDYTIKVAKGNTYGGEGCSQSGSSFYDWSNYDDLCGSNGLAAYIDLFGIAYFNTGNPEEFYNLFNNAEYSDCIANIQAALRRNE